MTTSVEFLGYIISNHGVSMDPRRVDSIKTWPQSSTLRELQMFLGFANFYRRFVRYYAKITRALTELLKGSKQGKQNGPFVFNKDAIAAFTALILAFTQAPMLVHFDPKNHIRVETDASGFAIAAILSQLVYLVGEAGEATWHPVAFYSRKMIPAETRYETHDQELLAIVTGFEQWRHYLEGSRYPIIVLTDHNNLRYFMKTTSLNRRQSRWALALAEYDFEIKYRTGKTNPADGPSRRPDYDGGADDEICLPTLQNKLRNITIAAIGIAPILTRAAAKAQLPHGLGAIEAPQLEELDDESTGEVPTKDLASTSVFDEEIEDAEDAKATEEDDAQIAHSAVTQQLRRSDARTACGKENHLEAPFALLLAKIGELQGKDPTVIKVKEQLSSDTMRAACAERGWSIHKEIVFYFHAVLVPDESALRIEILRLHHDDPLAGHFGTKKTRALMSRKFYWSRMTADIDAYVKGCDVCQRNKTPRHRPYGELASLPTPSRPWAEISMDFITELPPSRSGNDIYDAILVVVDRYSKMSLYIPAKSIWTAEDLADVLFEKVLLVYLGVQGIVFYRGSLFTSGYWFAICYRIRIKRRLSTAFHPQIDGQIERQNQTLEHYLRCYCNYKQDNWGSLLPLAQYTYNSAPHASIGVSLFESVFGIVADFRFNWDDKDCPNVLAARERIQSLWDERDRLVDRLKVAQEAQARSHANKTIPKTY